MQRVIAVLTIGPIYFSADRALVLVIAAVPAAIGERLVLQVALAALVADRAIERVVDEQELHHPFPRLLDLRAGGGDLHLVRGRQRAGRLRLGRPGFTSTRHIRQLPAMLSRS
jgi:hypothetical protein